jgi:hypothetical protein
VATSSGNVDETKRFRFINRVGRSSIPAKLIFLTAGIRVGYGRVTSGPPGVGVAVGSAEGVAPGVPVGVPLGAALGVGSGVALGVPLGVEVGVGDGVRVGVLRVFVPDPPVPLTTPRLVP